MNPTAIHAIRELRALAAQRANTAASIFRIFRTVSVVFGIISVVYLHLIILMLPSWWAFPSFLLWLFLYPICPGLWVEARIRRDKWMRMRQDCLDAATDIEKDWTQDNEDHDYDYNE
jgi:hypothetical protein